MTAPGHIVVIGGGIAGVSAAYFLAKSGACDRVTLLEAEAQLAHHTTGRSAAMFTENYGEGPVRPLTTASIEFFHEPPEDLVDHPLLTKRGIMTVSLDEAGYKRLDNFLDEGSSATEEIFEIPVAQARELAPHVRFGDAARITWEEHGYDIDVAGLHQAFVRGLRLHGAEVATARRVDAARPDGDRWHVETTQGPLTADVIINAAGAWGDVVAERAGVPAVGLQPLRRTAFMVNSPLVGSAEYPFVAEAHHNWYLRPDGNQFMCSPADETPSEPCDARPEEIDIARTIDMINEHTKLNVRSITSSWAGLRTFGPDRAMVIGPEPSQTNFFWCVGQGGTGIQTSPGAGQLVADLLVNGVAGTGFGAAGLNLASLLPDRVR